MVPTAVNPNTVPKCDVASDRPVGGFFPEANGTGLFDLPASTVYPPRNQSVPPVSVGIQLQSAASTLASRTPRSLMKLTPYNGTGCLETFLAKFNNMAQYLGWNEVDKY